jgi:CRISPR-associated protein Cst2
MRYYFKEAIRRNLDGGKYMCIPNDKGETCGDIAKCVACDLFGFMTTIKGKGAVTRVSPVKISPAMGLLPFEDNAVVDFLTRRHRMGEGEMGGDIVNVEIGVNVYKCGMGVDVARVGGEEKIEDKEPTVKIEYYLDNDERKKRIAKLLEVLRLFSDYSKQARLLTDFTPDFLLIAFQDLYSHRLQKALLLENGVALNIERLEAIVKDVKEYSPKIIAGILPGFLENEGEVMDVLEKLGVEVLSPNGAVKAALDHLNGLTFK